ncbi:Protein of unknown function [Gryllus bimaculatus]|nr:Protein of unknown function [Gryllus bimaculatus]
MTSASSTLGVLRRSARRSAGCVGYAKPGDTSSATAMRTRVVCIYIIAIALREPPAAPVRPVCYAVARRAVLAAAPAREAGWAGVGGGRCGRRVAADRRPTAGDGEPFHSQDGAFPHGGASVRQFLEYQAAATPSRVRVVEMTVTKKDSAKGGKGKGAKAAKDTAVASTSKATTATTESAKRQSTATVTKSSSTSSVSSSKSSRQQVVSEAASAQAIEGASNGALHVIEDWSSAEHAADGATSVRRTSSGAVANGAAVVLPADGAVSTTVVESVSQASTSKKSSSKKESFSSSTVVTGGTEVLTFTGRTTDVTGKSRKQLAQEFLLNEASNGARSQSTSTVTVAEGKNQTGGVTTTGVKGEKVLRGGKLVYVSPSPSKATASNKKQKGVPGPTDTVTVFEEIDIGPDGDISTSVVIDNILQGGDVVEVSSSSHLASSSSQQQATTSVSETVTIIEGKDSVQSVGTTSQIVQNEKVLRGGKLVHVSPGTDGSTKKQSVSDTTETVTVVEEQSSVSESASTQKRESVSGISETIITYVDGKEVGRTTGGTTTVAQADKVLRGGKLVEVSSSSSDVARSRKNESITGGTETIITYVDGKEAGRTTGDSTSVVSGNEKVLRGGKLVDVTSTSTSQTASSSKKHSTSGTTETIITFVDGKEVGRTSGGSTTVAQSEKVLRGGKLVEVSGSSNEVTGKKKKESVSGSSETVITYVDGKEVGRTSGGSTTVSKKDEVLQGGKFVEVSSSEITTSDRKDAALGVRETVVTTTDGKDSGRPAKSPSTTSPGEKVLRGGKLVTVSPSSQPTKGKKKPQQTTPTSTTETVIIDQGKAPDGSQPTTMTTVVPGGKVLRGGKLVSVSSTSQISSSSKKEAVSSSTETVTVVRSSSSTIVDEGVKKSSKTIRQVGGVSEVVTGDLQTITHGDAVSNIVRKESTSHEEHVSRSKSESVSHVQEVSESHQLSQHKQTARGQHSTDSRNFYGEEPITYIVEEPGSSPEIVRPRGTSVQEHVSTSVQEHVSKSHQQHVSSSTQVIENVSHQEFVTNQQLTDNTDSVTRSITHADRKQPTAVTRQGVELATSETRQATSSSQVVNEKVVSQQEMVVNEKTSSVTTRDDKKTKATTKEPKKAEPKQPAPCKEQCVCEICTCGSSETMNIFSKQLNEAYQPQFAKGFQVLKYQNVKFKTHKKSSNGTRINNTKKYAVFHEAYAGIRRWPWRGRASERAKGVGVGVGGVSFSLILNSEFLEEIRIICCRKRNTPLRTCALQPSSSFSDARPISKWCGAVHSALSKAFQENDHADTMGIKLHEPLTPNCALLKAEVKRRRACLRAVIYLNHKYYESKEKK